MCVTNLIKNRRLKCPTCRSTHKADHATQFPINYGMEEILKSLKSVQSIPSPQEEPTPLESGKINKIQSMLNEQERNFIKADELCQGTEHQLALYESKLVEWQCHHETLISKLNALVKSHIKVIKELKNEQSRVLTAQVNGQEQRKQRENVKQHLASISTAQEMVTAIEMADSSNTALEHWVKKCQECFPDVRVVYTSRKERRTTKKMLELVEKEEKSDESTPVCLGNVASTIMKKVQWVTNILSVEELRPLSKVMKTLLDAGRVMGVQEHQGHARSARMTLHNNKLHLHVLHDHPTPDNTYTLEHSCLMKLVDYSCAQVFLDFGWEGEMRGRVYIELNPDTGLARQFLMLCTGERGFSYHSTRLLEVVKQGHPGDYVCGGDYEKDTGDGGAPLLPGLQEDHDYERLAKSGLVGTLFTPGSPHCAQFYICIRDEDSSYGFTFGEVVSGLEVVKAATKLKNIADVKVVDCGVVLPL